MRFEDEQYKGFKAAYLHHKPNAGTIEILEAFTRWRAGEDIRARAHPNYPKVTHVSLVTPDGPNDPRVWKFDPLTKDVTLPALDTTPGWRCDQHSCPERAPVFAAAAPRCYTCDRPMVQMPAAAVSIPPAMTKLERIVLGYAPHDGPPTEQEVLDSKFFYDRVHEHQMRAGERVHAEVERIAEIMKRELKDAAPLLDVEAEPRLMKSWQGWQNAFKGMKAEKWGESPLMKALPVIRAYQAAWPHPPARYLRDSTTSLVAQLDIAVGADLDWLAGNLLGIERDRHLDMVRGSETDNEYRDRVISLILPHEVK